MGNGIVLISLLKRAVRTLKRVCIPFTQPSLIVLYLSVPIMCLIDTFLLSSTLAGAPTIDKRGNYVECHIFVPFGGIGKPKRNDRVFVVVSPDGRVHEAPIVQ